MFTHNVVEAHTDTKPAQCNNLKEKYEVSRTGIELDPLLSCSVEVFLENGIIIHSSRWYNHS